MKNEKMVLKIAEPWDFTSSDGDNTLIVEILFSQGNDKIIVKCCSDFKNKRGDYLFLKKRNSFDYNIHAIGDSIINEKMDFKLLEFIMIGGIEKISGDS